MERSDRTWLPKSLGILGLLAWVALGILICGAIVVLVWQFLKPSPEEPSELHTGQREICALCFTPNEDTLLIAGEDGTVQFREYPSGSLVKTLHAHERPIEAMALAPAGGTLFTADLDGCLRVWDLRNGNMTHSLNMAGERICAMALHPRGRCLAIACEHSVRLWKFANGNHVEVLANVKFEATSVSFSSDGKLLAFCHNDEPVIHIWSIDPVKELRRFRYSEPYACTVQFVGKRHILAVGGTYRPNTLPFPVDLWDADVGIRMERLDAGNRGSVDRFAATPDGEILASGDSNGWVCVWDMTTRKLIKCWRAHTASITSLVITRDGKGLVTGCADVIEGRNRPFEGGHTSVKFWRIKD
jgi:WD40 repeat protein